MKNIAGVCLLLAAGFAQAATVTIDFEEFTVGQAAPLQSKGYDIYGYGSGTLDPDSAGAAVGAANSKFFEVWGTEIFPVGAELQIGISRTDDSAFALYSLEGSGVFSTPTIIGVRAGGGTIQGGLADLGSGDWLNISSATLYFSTPSYIGGWTFSGGVDNIVVGSASVVPVPAAVWLFVSGLGLLGWMRSK